jgi:non-specific serine/threonine protein kinase
VTAHKALIHEDNLDAEFWRRIEAVLDDALELPPEAVPAHLDRVCTHDLELRRAVEALLEADAQAGPFLSATPATTGAGPWREVRDSTVSDARRSRASDEDDVAPARLGRFTVLGELGRGGMGVVHLGRDETLGRSVAIKMLPERFSRDPERLSRFLREAKLLATLHHPNIATIHGLERSEDGRRFLILERVEGATLADRLRDGPLPVREALDVGAQIAAGLAAAHACGIVHRDIKPSNVMLTGSGLAKILDFGLAKYVAHDESRDARESSSWGAGESSADLLTAAGARVGTPGYMSPEQLLGHPLDVRSDVYSFGCVLYECLTGERAAGGRTPMIRAATTLSGSVDWSRLPGSLQENVRGLLVHLLEKDPQRRVSDIRVVADVLARAAGADEPWAGPGWVVARGNLPRHATRFVGRAGELEECVQLLARARLVTITGAGGCGKTRLALEIARSVAPRFPGGAWYVDLARVAEPEGVPSAIAATLEPTDHGASGPMASAIRKLQDQAALVVLDNCEHVLAACAAHAAALLEACPGVRMLATSREWLGAHGEQTFLLGTMPVPDPERDRDLETIERTDSVRLFVQTARLARRDFRLTPATAPAVARICTRLDGIPLAIELAGALVRDRSLDEIAGVLDERLRSTAAFHADGAARHDTLQATLRWSHDQLTRDEQELFRSLSVFTGGWTLDAATAVCGNGRDEFGVLDLVTRLVDKSLVVIERADRVEPRYRFLEPVREVAAALCDEWGMVATLRDRHLEYLLSMAERSTASLVGGPDQATRLAELEADHQNLLAALRWCEQTRDGADKALRLAGAAWWFWYVRGHFGLGRDALARVLAMPGAQAPTHARALALFAAGGLAVFQGDYPAGMRLNGEALDLYRRLGDPLGIARALAHLGTGASGLGLYEEARTALSEARDIFRSLGDGRRLGVTLNNLGVVARQQGDYGLALEAYEEALDLVRESGDQHGLCLTLVNLALVSIRMSRPDPARVWLAEALRLVHEMSAKRGATAALEVAAELIHHDGAVDDAARLIGAAEALRSSIGLPQEGWWRKTQVEFQARLGADLGAVHFERLRNEGRGWPFDTAVAFARERIRADVADSTTSSARTIDTQPPGGGP